MPRDTETVSGRARGQVHAQVLNLFRTLYSNLPTCLDSASLLVYELLVGRGHIVFMCVSPFWGICSTDVCTMNELMSQSIHPCFNQLTLLVINDWELSGCARSMPRSAGVLSYRQLHVVVMLCRCGPGKPIALQLSLWCH